MGSFSVFLAFLFVTISLAFLLKLLSSMGSDEGKGRYLPPGPASLPIIGNVHQLGFILANIVPALRRFRACHGPVFRVYIGKRIMVFIAKHELAHQALVQMGTTLAGRPHASASLRVFNTNQHNINSANYGPLWRLFRRNLMAGTLSPSSTKHFSEGRRWVMDVLTDKLKDQAERNGWIVMPIESFRYGIFCLLFFMCFGQKIEEVAVQKVERTLRNQLLSLSRFNLLGIFPRLSKIFLWRRWHDLKEIRRNEELTLLPFIRAHATVLRKNSCCYVDTLLALEHPEGRRLSDGEMVTLCAEFLMAGGTDTTSTTLQWVMANLVRSPRIQAKLYDEIRSIVGDREEVAEEDLQQMPYLKAVILEALRRHPPAQLLLPHTTSEDVSIGGYHIPKDAIVNFMIGDMGLDEKVWKDAMEFRPERFMPGGEGEDVDITGTREVKMIPFSAGRRICPGMGLAMLHLQYYVANLVLKFQWLVVEGEEVDLTEKAEIITVVMKHSLKARLAPRDQIVVTP